MVFGASVAVPPVGSHKRPTMAMIYRNLSFTEWHHGESLDQQDGDPQFSSEAIILPSHRQTVITYGSFSLYSTHDHISLPGHTVCH